jgi:hypothetical protein
MGETAASNDARPGRRRREAPPMLAIAVTAAAGWLAVRGSARVPPGAVTRLAAIVAERLAERSEIT